MAEGDVIGIDGKGKSVPLESSNAVEWALNLGYLKRLDKHDKWETRYLRIPTLSLAHDVRTLVNSLISRGRNELRDEIRNLIGAAEDVP